LDVVCEDNNSYSSGMVSLFLFLNSHHEFIETESLESYSGFSFNYPIDFLEY